MTSEEKTSQNDFLAELTTLGVKNPDSPSTEELTLILKAMLENKKINSETIISYLGNANIALESYYTSLKDLSTDSRIIGEKTLDLIQEGVQILGVNLQNKNLRAKERSEIRIQINDLMAKAVEVHHRQAKSRDVMVTTGGGVLVAFLAILATLFGRRNDT